MSWPPNGSPVRRRLPVTSRLPSAPCVRASPPSARAMPRGWNARPCMTRPPARMSAVMWTCRSAKPWTSSPSAALASAGVGAATASATSAPVASLLTRRRTLRSDCALQRRRHFARHELHGAVVHRRQLAEEEVAYAELGIRAELLDALLRRAHDHHLLQPLGQRVAVQLGRPLARAPLVLLEQRAERERLPHVAAVAPDVGAVPGEHVEQVPVVIEVAVKRVPDVAVLGHDPQGAALAGAADYQRQGVLHRLRLEPRVLQLEVLALERRRLLRPQAPHDPTGLVEHVHADADPRERDAVLVVLELEPRRPHPELEPAIRDVVDGRGHIRDHRRVPVGHPEHEHAAAHAARVRRHRGQQRQALELRAGRVTVDGVEVVEVRDPVVAEFLGAQPELAVVVVARVLRAGVDAEADGVTEDLHAQAFAVSRSKPGAIAAFVPGITWWWPMFRSRSHDCWPSVSPTTQPSSTSSASLKCS